MKIYADNAATTRLAPEALNAMMPFLTDDFGNASSLHTAGFTARKALDEARETIAACIGALPEEIFFTSGGTESDNWAIKGFGGTGPVYASAVEHHAVLNSLPSNSILLPVDAQGHISPEKLAESLQKKPGLVSVMLANNETGTVEPVHDISEIVHRYGGILHSDAVQALGHIPVSVRKLDVDLLSASAHKFRGPKGIGFLYCRKGIAGKRFMDGGGQENTMRAGTENVASIAGMAAALKLGCEKMEETSGKLKKMTRKIQTILSAALSGIRFNGDPLHHLPGLLSVSIPGISGEGLLHYLDLKGVAVSTGAACRAESEEISHVLKAIGLPDDLAGGTIRLSLGAENRECEAAVIARHILDYCETIGPL